MEIVSNVVLVTSMLETFTASGTSEGRETRGTQQLVTVRSVCESYEVYKVCITVSLFDGLSMAIMCIESANLYEYTIVL